LRIALHLKGVEMVARIRRVEPVGIAFLSSILYGILAIIGSLGFAIFRALSPAVQNNGPTPFMLVVFPAVLHRRLRRRPLVRFGV